MCGPVIHLQRDLRRVAVNSHDAGRHWRLGDSLGPLCHGLCRQSIWQDVQQLTVRLRPAPTPGKVYGLRGDHRARNALSLHQLLFTSS